MGHHHNNHHQQQQQFGINIDLSQLVNGSRSTQYFPSIPAHPSTVELFPGHPNPTPTHQQQQQHHEMMMMMFGRQVAADHVIMPPRFLHDHFVGSSNDVAATPTTATSASTTPSLSGLEATETAAGGDGYNGGSSSRWPRQETLTLLEIRSRLHPKFKEANQKGPLWDEVSRIMCEEHGYQRSGKKCREKFENLYKYYKKTKEGKAGRQDGKHYRFFRQLEALYGGEKSNPTSSLLPNTNLGTNFTFPFPSQTNQEIHCDTLSLTNSTHQFDTSSSHDNENRSGRRKWKLKKIKDLIDSQMRKVVEKQEEWLDKLMKTLEHKEKERVMREEEWKKQEVERLEKEHLFWAKERAWIEARDAAFMEALQQLTGRIQNQNELNESEILVNNTTRNAKVGNNNHDLFKKHFSTTGLIDDY